MYLVKFFVIINMLMLMPVLTNASSVAADPVQELLPEPDQRYRVVDGIDGKALPVVRTQPDPTAEELATLAAGASDIVVAGTRLEAHGVVWWQVVHKQTLGWVEASHLAPMTVEMPLQEVFPLRCVGTEPFWSLHIEGGQGVFETPESSQHWAAGEINTAVGMVGRYAVRLENDGAVGHLAAWRNPHFCSDSMSNIGYPFEGIVVVPDGTAYSGCCLRAGGGDAAGR